MSHSLSLGKWLTCSEMTQKFPGKPAFNLSEVCICFDRFYEMAQLNLHCGTCVFLFWKFDKGHKYQQCFDKRLAPTGCGLFRFTSSKSCFHVIGGEKCFARNKACFPDADAIISQKTRVGKLWPANFLNPGHQIWHKKPNELEVSQKKLYFITIFFSVTRVFQ